MASATPILVFVMATLILVVAGAPQVEGMILAAMLGLSIGMIFARNLGDYCETLFTLMANRTAAVAIVCWLWAGAFSGVLADCDLVEAIVWVGWKLGLSGGLFTLTVFVCAALFAVSLGTGLGTVLGFTAVMYPAGVVLGANPAAVMGAIISGAAFGDNLAPVSDTTIVSAATQEADVGGVVRSRLKYVLLAAALSGVLFLTFGAGKSTVDPSVAEKILQENSDPKGLPMLIPAAIVFAIAFSGYHFLLALTAGILCASLLGPSLGIFDFKDLFHVTPDGAIEGSLVGGAMGLVPTAVLTLLLVTSIGLMKVGGFLDELMNWLDKGWTKTVARTEGAIIALISIANLCVSVNTVAMIAVGPLANVLRKRHQIHSYRVANLLDTVSCSFPYMLPYAAAVTASSAIQREVAERYDFVPIVSWSEELPFIFYGLTLFPIMILAVITGFGRRHG
ncbi:MAG: Na+/H+ antiporter NhaC family protein [Candidatus Omnitrophica bacterium]|nr:Na+/H+ antiporter NhaC family protein [Candidatus Omnitrophota bacterium]MCA9435286.1 Na+/H+ antiporter NhaC family protein [Candidatus Omnitrophota bacterium]